jgi:hypothetical protein
VNDPRARGPEVVEVENPAIAKAQKSRAAGGYNELNEELDKAE